MNALLSRPRLILTMLATAAAFAFASLAGPVTPSASASNRTIISVVGHWVPIIDRDESAIVKAEKAHKLRRSIRDYKHEVKDLHHWVAQLKAQSASSRKGVTARKDVIAGVNKVAKAYARLAKGLGTTLTKAEFKRDRRLAGAGRKQVNRGIELLRTL